MQHAWLRQQDVADDEQVSAVMGPSGSGKSTLLAVLMGTATYGTFTGQVWINGRLMKVSRLRRIMGYVPQVGPAKIPPGFFFFFSLSRS